MEPVNVNRPMSSVNVPMHIFWSLLLLGMHWHSLRFLVDVTTSSFACMLGSRLMGLNLKRLVVVVQRQ